MQLTPLRNKFTVELRTQILETLRARPNKLNFLILLLGSAFVLSCGAKTAKTPPAPSVQGTASFEALTQGLTYIRANPATREEEQVQRYLWLDQWVKTLGDRGRLTPEMAQEYWSDFDSFLKQPPAGESALEKILSKVQSKIAKNVALYASYQEVLKNQRLEASLRFLEQIEEDGTTGLFARSQEILQLNNFQPVAGSRKVGVLLPLSGDLKAFAQEALLGIQIASRMGIAEGVEFIIEDSGGNRESLAKAFQKLANEENVTVVLGPLTARETEYAFEMAEVTRLPVISLAAKEDLKSYGNYSFRSVLSLDDQLKELARFLKEDLKSKRLAVLTPDSNYGWDTLDRAGPILSDAGLEVTELQVYPAGATDFKEQLRRMTRLDFPRLRKDELCPKAQVVEVSADEAPAAIEAAPTTCVKKLADLRPIVTFDTLFIPDFAETVGLVLPTLPYLRLYGVQVVTLSGANSRRLIERGAQSAEGTFIVDSYEPNSESYSSRFFRDEFQKLSAREPSRIAAEAFDLALVTLSVMTRDDKTVSRDLFIDRLRRVENFQGVTGNINFQDQRLSKQPQILTVRDQQITALKK